MKRTLFDADTIIDIDYGLLRIFQIKYKNPKLIDPAFIQMEEHEVLDMLKNRENENPLELILNDSLKDQADAYREEFFRQEEELIYSNALIFGATYNLIRTVLFSKLSTIDVYCKNKHEERIVRNLFGDSVNYVYERPYDIYHTLVFKKWNDIIEDIDNLLEKCVYIMAARFNYSVDEKGLPHMKDPRFDILLRILDITFMDFHV